MRRNYPINIVIGGLFALVIVMGIGRFAYTPILPFMLEAKNFSEKAAGYVASANYFGYLLGALLAGTVKWRKGRKFHLTINLLLNVITTLAMGLTEHHVVWFMLRFISGFSSGLVFVFASSIVMDYLAYYKRLTWSGLFYGGVGIGILLSGLFVPILNHYYSWQGSWIGLGLLAGVFTIFTLMLVKDSPPSKNSEITLTEENVANHHVIVLPWLIASYGCEGIGYIISGTFLVTLVQNIPGLNHIPSLSWVFVGIAAAPSCILWSLAAKRWGHLPTLQLAFALQTVGVILPVFLFNIYGALMGAFLFGATFMGITTLFVAEVRNITPSESSKVISYLTFFYGIGQMIGPAIGGMFITKSGGYGSALVFASSVLLVGMVFLSVAQFKEKKLKKLQIIK
ncbi:YbfB/YjiJ family MFS transporter [Bacillus aquiflavi]|uniref:YbfB/YjiJ family MFS transporter n=1 Tax=Bacillus aquiflavi TaxID=2672567 RepID=UPI001CA95D34|nr:YbfB/YjiJ family MFS transporter [Bacillus aquiflavi]UAC48434.1 YbfB/YjiJ family MFS transporter [Bacillus aquiflavi]